MCQFFVFGAHRLLTKNGREAAIGGLFSTKRDKNKNSSDKEIRQLDKGGEWPMDLWFVHFQCKPNENRNEDKCHGLRLIHHVCHLVTGAWIWYVGSVERGARSYRNERGFIWELTKIVAQVLKEKAPRRISHKCAVTIAKPYQQKV